MKKEFRKFLLLLLCLLCLNTGTPQPSFGENKGLTPQSSRSSQEKNYCQVGADAVDLSRVPGPDERVVRIKEDKLIIYETGRYTRGEPGARPVHCYLRAGQPVVVDKDGVAQWVLNCGNKILTTAWRPEGASFGGIPAPPQQTTLPRDINVHVDVSGTVTHEGDLNVHHDGKIGMEHSGGIAAMPTLASQMQSQERHGMSTGAKVGIGGVIVALVALGAYFATHRGNKTIVVNNPRVPQAPPAVLPAAP